MNMLTEAAVEQKLDGMKNERDIKMRGVDVTVHYGDKQALFDVNLDVPDRQVMALIGPSGCGKSTFLRCLNRMNDTIDICRVGGKLTLDDQNIYDPKIDVVELRARVGMVFQKPNPFPKSIYENVAYGPRIHGLARSKSELDDLVRRAVLDDQCVTWREVAEWFDVPRATAERAPTDRARSRKAVRHRFSAAVGLDAIAAVHTWSAPVASWW